jgi:hypothetical protein
MIRVLVRGGISVAIALALAAASLSAHPLATTTVSIAAASPEHLTVTIAAEADPLIAKLEVLAGVPASSPAAAASRRARLQSLAPALINHIDARLDGLRLALQLQGVDVDDTAQTEIRLTAAISPGPRMLTWQSTFVFGSYPIAVRGPEGVEVVQWLQGPTASTPIHLDAPHAPQGFAASFLLGFTHIVPAGLDHILFVLGLFLLSRKNGEILMQVTAFTVAHSITLASSLYGFVLAPPSIVEPLIALSVAYVGVENLVTTRLHPWRIAVVFTFGLMHGMGFAEALADLQLSASGFVTTLVAFNAGVEAGQLAVIAVAAGVLALVARYRATARVPTARFASAAIGLMGVLWTIQRLAGG